MRKIGNFEVNPVGLGCMGMSEFYGSTNDNQSRDVINAAIELGVNHFDTADIYGHGHNEKLLGDTISDSGKRSSLVIASKCGIIRDPNDPSRRGIDNSPEYIRESVNKSIERLKTHIDIYYLHRIENGGEKIEESMRELAYLIKEGLIGGVGLSEANASVITRAHQALLSETGGKHGLAAVQTEFSLMSRDVEHNNILDTCENNDITFVAYSPISRGLLSAQFKKSSDLGKDDFRRTLPRFSDEAIEKNYLISEKIGYIAQSSGLTPTQLAIAWVIHRRSNIVTIPGTKTLKYLKENSEVNTLTLSTEVFIKVDNVFAEFDIAGKRYSDAVLEVYGL